MKKLFNAFTPVNLEEWMTKITTDLKGKSIDILNSKPETDLDTVAYHHPETTPDYPSNSKGRNLMRISNDWEIRQSFSGKTDQETNKKILASLNEGVNHIGLAIDQHTNITELTKEILFEHIGSDIYLKDKTAALNFQGNESSDLNFDIIGRNAMQGNSTLTLEDFYSFYGKNKNVKTVWVSGIIYGETGASTLQELAFTCSHLNEYMHLLTEKGHSLEEINEKIILEISVNENYFVNIAKFRVIRELVALLFKGYDPDYSIRPIRIYAKTSLRHHAKNDQNNNVLRETTQAMSAVIGGADVITVDFPTFGNETEQIRFERIAKNIQLILKEESYLDKVVDPSAGSYYIESLTNQVLEKSWALFQEIERSGGLLLNLQNNHVQERIEVNRQALITSLNDGSRTFLGVNKYPNGMEEWTAVHPPENKQETTYKPLDAFYLEAFYKKEEVA